ncbi:NAD(P)H-binding protein [Lapidilactobacillus wuchangensis]|uniref:NAD(P)H-binding protein n=1 Tax=Lapidilactobacillus wuchangensis TaxID=2486001 RepID=UPI000F77CFF6|nr:NAD(P)H-binding protein [Lapidilactobacillus wuchangensis]
MTKVIILGAASQISRYLIPDLLTHSAIELTLFARQASQRLAEYRGQAKLIDGDWNQVADLVPALTGQGLVFLASSEIKGNTAVVAAMKQAGVSRLIVAGGLGMNDEVAGEFGRWNARMMGDYSQYKQAAAIIWHSGLNYTYLRMTWLYDQKGNTKYQVVPLGEPLKGTQITRQAVAAFVTKLILQPDLYQQDNIGLVEPNTEWDKPSFY